MASFPLPSFDWTSNVAVKKQTAFENVRNLFVLTGLSAAGAAFGRSEWLAMALPGALWWLLVGTFMGMTIWLGSKLALQVADPLVETARRYLVGPIFGRLALPTALAVFTPLCALGAAIVLAPFFPELVVSPGR